MANDRPPAEDFIPVDSLAEADDSTNQSEDTYSLGSPISSSSSATYSTAVMTPPAPLASSFEVSSPTSPSGTVTEKEVATDTFEEPDALYWIKVPQPATLAARRKIVLKPIVTALCRDIRPLESEVNQIPHPAHPKTFWEYHLLTEAKLNALASYYHQRPWTPNSLYLTTGARVRPGSFQEPPFPTIETYLYPWPITWDEGFLARVGELRGHEERVRIKRRKFGKFIGLDCCMTPPAEIEEYQIYKHAQIRSRETKGAEYPFFPDRFA